jgi:hypothetical protein
MNALLLAASLQGGFETVSRDNADNTEFNFQGRADRHVLRVASLLTDIALDRPRSSSFNTAAKSGMTSCAFRPDKRSFPNVQG